jgi:molybdopterin synthase sulfur carrier subunit
MINVRVRLYATLRHYQPGLGIGESLAVELPDGATVGDLLRKLAVPLDEVKILFVNSLFGTEGQVLADGDDVGVFPAVGGG